MRRRLMYAAAAAWVAAGCGSPQLALVWNPIDDVNGQLPDGVTVYEGVDVVFPLRAWYARIEADAAASLQIQQSDDQSDNRETVESFATDEGACIAVNGGYFTMAQNPAAHSGLLVENGTVRWRATRAVVRDSVEYPTARAAIGVEEDGSVEIAWVTSSGDSVVSWAAPPPNSPGFPANPDAAGRTEPWPVVDAIAAGPRLIRSGAVDITADEEVFFGSSIPDVHPRTAAGVTEDGDVLLLVVDGRQPASRGVDLNELASILLRLGAVEALNLDGGGSSTFYAGGAVLNRPAGGDNLREVMSAITVHCGP